MLFHIVAILLAALQVLADTCPISFVIYPNGNKDYCLTIEEVHTGGSLAYVRRCTFPRPFRTSLVLQALPAQCRVYPAQPDCGD